MLIYVIILGITAPYLSFNFKTELSLQLLWKLSYNCSCGLKHRKLEHSENEIHTLDSCRV